MSGIRCFSARAFHHSFYSFIVAQTAGAGTGHPRGPLCQVVLEPMKPVEVVSTIKLSNEKKRKGKGKKKKLPPNRYFLPFITLKLNTFSIQCIQRCIIRPQRHFQLRSCEFYICVVETGCKRLSCCKAESVGSRESSAGSWLLVVCAHSCDLTPAQGSTQYCWHLAEARNSTKDLSPCWPWRPDPPSRCVLSITSTHLHCMTACSLWYPGELIAVGGPAACGHRQVQAERGYLFYSREGWSGCAVVWL